MRIIPSSTYVTSEGVGKIYLTFVWVYQLKPGDAAGLMRKRVLNRKHLKLVKYHHKPLQRTP